MIVDASAVIAILDDEPDGDEFLALLAQGQAGIPAPAFVEAAIVMDHRRVAVPSDRVEAFLAAAQVEVLAFTPAHARAARAAYRKFGRGSGHPARLNFGDCLVYAVAEVEDEPLLFKGEDFSHTDVRPVRRHAGHEGH